MNYNLFFELSFRILVSVAAVIIIAQFGKFQIPFEFYYIWKLITLGSPDIYEGICKPETYNNNFRNSKIIYGFNGIYKAFSLIKDKSTAIGFYEHLDPDAKIAKKDLFKSIQRISNLIFNSDEIIELKLILNQIENKFPSVLTTKHIYLIQSIILTGLNINLTKDTLDTCFDLAVDENEDIFQRSENDWDLLKLQLLSETLIEFIPISKRFRFNFDILNFDLNAKKQEIYFDLKYSFVNKVSEHE